MLIVALVLSLVSQPGDGTLLSQFKALQAHPQQARRLLRSREAESLALINDLRDTFDRSIHSARSAPEQRRVEYDAATLEFGIILSRLYADVTHDTRPWRQFVARQRRIQGTESLNARHYLTAMSKLASALREAEALDDAWLMVITRLNMAYARIEMGDGALARDLCAAAAKDAERLGPRAKGLAAFDLAAAYAHLNEFAASIPYARLAVGYSHDAGIKLWEGNALLNLGVAYRQVGDLALAETTLEQGLAVIRQTADQLGTGRALYDLALVSLDKQQYSKAAAYLEQALPIIATVDVRHSHEIELDPRQYYNSVTRTRCGCSCRRTKNSRNQNASPSMKPLSMRCSAPNRTLRGRDTPTRSTCKRNPPSNSLSSNCRP